MIPPRWSQRKLRARSHKSQRSRRGRGRAEDVTLRSRAGPRFARMGSRGNRITSAQELDRACDPIPSRSQRRPAGRRPAHTGAPRLVATSDRTHSARLRFSAIPAICDSACSASSAPAEGIRGRLSWSGALEHAGVCRGQKRHTCIVGPGGEKAAGPPTPPTTLPPRFSENRSKSNTSVPCASSSDSV